MEAFETSRKQAVEKVTNTLAQGRSTKSDNPLLRAFFADSAFVEATREGMRAVEAGETGILLEDLRRQVSESSAP